MFKFIVIVIAVMTTLMERPQIVAGRPGDITDAAENVDVPPEHRAAPPMQQQPAQPPVFQPRAVFPAGGPQYPLYFPTQNGFVPFGSIYNTYPPQQVQQQQQQQRQALIWPPEPSIIAPIVVAAN